MLAYAANRPVAGKRPSSPSAMLFIVSAHVALIALVMSARNEFAPPQRDRTTIDWVPAPAPPPPHPAETQTRPSKELPATNPKPDFALPLPDPVRLDPGVPVDPGIAIGGGTSSIPYIPVEPLHTPVHHNPRLLTAPDELKPPYPQSKIFSGEEARLQLRLTINEAGRVIAVDPIGPADREFLEVARRYLMAHWRYRPATDDGRAVASSITIVLHFQLDG